MAQSFNTNLFNIAKHYTRLLKAPVTKTTLKSSLEQNPYYPSLYSLSNVFDKFGIANEAFTVDEEYLHRLETPFITYCSGQNTGKDFVLVTKMTDTTVSYIAENSKPKQVSKENFLNQWQKTVFVAEVNAESGEKDYNSKLKIEKSKSRKQAVLYAGVLVLIGLMVYLFIGSAGTGNIIAAAAIISIKLAGLAVTVLLLVYELDKTNKFVKNICSAGRQTNCDAVLKSKAGTILSMTWGEVGFFYFASTTLFLVLPGWAFINKLPWLAIASTLAAPYILFSIYYQWKIVKQWCLLCLAVQAVLAMELIWAVIYFWLKSPLTSSGFPPPLGEIVGAACCLLLIILAWYFLKPTLLAAQTAPGYNAAYKRLLYNPETFNNLLLQQSVAPTGWEDLGINIGNPNASNNIISVCNPYCDPCAKAHHVFDELIKYNKDINVKIVFAAASDENDESNKPVKHLLAISAKSDLQMTEKALLDWYSAKKKDYDDFANKYPLNGELNEQKIRLEAMRKWCLSAEITGTPTIFVNGRRLPETYNINELKDIF